MSSPCTRGFLGAAAIGGGAREVDSERLAALAALGVRSLVVCLDNDPKPDGRARTRGRLTHRRTRSGAQSPSATPVTWTFATFHTFSPSWTFPFQAIMQCLWELILVVLTDTKRRNQPLDGEILDSVKIAVSMNLFSRGACASLVLGSALVLVGCGGGGSGIATPTRTAPPTGSTGSPPTTVGGSQPITADQIVFVSNRTGATELFKANANGSNPVQLTQLAKQGYANIYRPSVSPDGARIVFQYGTPHDSASTNNLEIALINTDGSGLIKLTNDTNTVSRPDDYNPIFSADNQYIYWTSGRSSANAQQIPHIYRMDAAPGGEGKNQKQFVSEPSSYPSLDRAGTTLAYIAPGQASDPIALQPLSNNAVTGTIKRIGGAINGGSAFSLAISPDASRVAFSSIVNPDASGGTSVMTAPSAQLNLFSTASNTSLGAMPSGGTINADAAWSRDSGTLYFDAKGGSTPGIQLFSSPFPFTTQTPITTGDANSQNFASAFLTGK